MARTKTATAPATWWAWVIAASLLVAGTSPAESREAPRVVRVTPAILDSSLVCGLTTRGIPDLPSRETLLSGLPSALVFGFSVLKPSGERVGGSRAEIRIEPDLWENLFVLRTPLFTETVTAMRDVESLLAHIQPVPIMPMSRLDPHTAYRVQVQMAVYPLAPSQTARSRSWLTGDTSLGDPGRREISVGLSSILRFFLGRTHRDRWVAKATSPSFRKIDLERIPIRPQEQR